MEAGTVEAGTVEADTVADMAAGVMPWLDVLEADTATSVVGIGMPADGTSEAAMVVTAAATDATTTTATMAAAIIQERPSSAA
jgi:hypothetical protein